MNPLTFHKAKTPVLITAFVASLFGVAQAAEQPTPDLVPALSVWAAERVAARPGVPSPETRSRKGELESDPARATLSLLGRHVADIPQSLAAAGPQALALDAEDLVYTIAFKGSDGSDQQFAAHYRPDDARPLYLLASGSPPVPDATFEQASEALVERVLGGSTEGLRVSGRLAPVDAAEIAVFNREGPVSPPWPSCWLFLVDDEPAANWEHPCRYVFLAPDLSAFAVQYGRSILELFDLTQAETPQNYLSLIVPHPAVDTPRPLSDQPAAQVTPLSISFSGSAQNCYAVILSGGVNAYNNWQRYWEDSANIYYTLKHKYGLADDHIIALVSDGTDPANDRDIGTREDPVYANSNPDLDGDGVTDVDGPCTLAEVQAAFDDLAAILTSNDQLFVFITDHGYQESGWDAGACLWGGDNLRDDQLADMTADLPCPVMYALETCYSGGFVDDITATANRVIGAACAYNDTSEGWWHYDPWVYYFTAAVRGCYPQDYPADPWDDGTGCDVDANADNRISFREAWNHAWNNRAASDVPQLGENPSGLGDSLFMQHFHIALNNDSPYLHLAIPKDFSFQVKTYDWAAVGINPSSDHDVKADNNRQLTSPYAFSSQGSTTRDFVVYNGHTLAANALHYAQVYFGSASLYSIEAEWEANDPSLGVAFADSLSGNEVLDVFEAYLYAGTSYDVTVNVTSGNPDVSVHVYTPSLTSGSRSTATWANNTGGAGADEAFSFRAVTTGYHAFIVVNNNSGSGNYSFLIDESPPLAAPTGVSASDGTRSDAIAVSWLPVAGATHYKIYRYTSNSSGSATALNDWTTGTNYVDYTATVGRDYYYWVKAAATSEGDRESAFSSSDTGYVDPTTLSSDSAVSVTANPSYYDFTDTYNYWWILGIRRTLEADIWNIALYDTPAFNSLLRYSSYPYPVNFIVGDQNHLGSQKRGVYAYRGSGSGSATVEYEGGNTTLPIGTVSTNTWPAGDVAEIWDLYLSAGTTYKVTLNVVSGSADLDIALFGSQDSVYIKHRENHLARSITGGAGASESFIYSVPLGAADWYGFCVWANNGNSATYTLLVETIASGIWSGTVSTNWFNVTNWVSGVLPTALLDATIPAGTPYSPVVGSGTANCRDLILASGAKLLIGNATLNAANDVHVNGELRLLHGDALLSAAGNFYWHAGSTAVASGSWPSIDVYGILSLEDGTAADLTSFNFRFKGSSPSYIRSFEESCVLGWVQNYKEPSTYLALSAMSVQPCRIIYLFNYSGHTFTTYSDEEIQIQSYYYGTGNIQLDRGVLAFTGTCYTNYPVQFNPGDRIHDLVMRGSGTLTLGGDYTNTAPILGSVTISSGQLDGRHMNLEVGGNWSNAVGTAGFDAGTKSVTFNGVGVQQNITGTNVFYDLIDARSGGDQLVLRGDTTVQHDFTAGYQIAVWAPLSVQNTLDLSDTGCQLILWGDADAYAHQLDLGGSLLVYSGALTADDLLDNGLYGFIAINGGHVTLTQASSGTGEWFDLHGTLHMTDGQLDLIGGSDDHYWPLSGSCLFTMDGGTLDFHNRGWHIRSGFSGAISNGTLRCAGNVFAQTSAFNPAGGVLELYGGINASLQQTAGSSFPRLIVNKNKYIHADADTDLTVTGNVELRGGTLHDAARTLYVHGGWSNVVGSAGFDEGTGTVSFVGGSPVKIWTRETFHNLEIAKTYAGITGVEIGNETHVSNDLAITDGTLEMNAGAVLDVERDLSIASGAGLNADDAAALEIRVGRHWSNLNTSFSKTVGFSPGYHSLVVFDGSGVSGDLTTACAQETFNKLTINRPSGTLCVHNNMTLRGDLNILAGSWSKSGGPYEDRFRGNFTVEPAGSWYDTTATVVFDGTGTQAFDDRSVSGWYQTIVVEKYTGVSILPLTLLSNMLILNNGSLTVREGNMDLNGHYVRCTGNVTVESGGSLNIGAGAWLEVGGSYALSVQSGGRLEVRGTAGSPALVTHHSGNYAFTMAGGSTLVAGNAVFEYMDANGLTLADGAALVEPYTFNGCTFRYGVSGGTLLTLNNTQTFTAQHANFPANMGGGASNVRKGSASGIAHFVHADGVFAGEGYDNDPLNLVNWHTGASSSLSLAGPSAATLGGTYDFTATLSGDMPLTPITYRWTVTDLSPATHTHNAFTDPMNGCVWSTAGTKTLLVTASNELGTVSGSLPVAVAVLAVDITGRHWVGTTNAVDLVILGTSSASTYRIQYRASLTAGAWADAAPDGLLIEGSDGSTPWVDMGGPGRDVTASSNMFYRALLLP